MTLRKKPFENIVGKEEMLETSIFSLFHNVFDPSQAKLQFLFTFIVSSANAFNVDQSKILLFGKELKQVENIVEK